MKKPTEYRAWLIDVEGVLVRDKRYQPIDGAVDWFNALVAQGQPHCLVSNNTTHSPAELVADLQAAGFHLTEDHLVGALDLGRRWLESRGRRHLRWLGHPRLDAYWQEAGFELTTDGPCDAVVLGANSQLQVEHLDQALAPLLDDGADLVCLHRNLFFLDEQGQRRLGPGVWAAALEALDGAGKVVTIGKPEEAIYTSALKRVGVDAEEALFISDDPISDLVTAGRLGMTTAFVLSGKYPDHTVLGRLDQEQWPDIICQCCADLKKEA